MRRRLAFLVSATMALVLVAFVVPLAILVRVIVADRAVSSATSAAQQLSAEVAAGTTDASLRTSVMQLAASSGRPVTVFLPAAVPRSAPRPRRTASVQLAQRTQSSFTVADARRPGDPGRGGGRARRDRGGPDLRQQCGADPRGHRGVADPGRPGPRAARARHGHRRSGWPARSTRPIAELARVSQRLADGDLEARADPAGPPEVREVAGSLNYLAGRIRELIWQERETFADLSHRLRTPLTALRLEAEAADYG